MPEWLKDTSLVTYHVNLCIANPSSYQRGAEVYSDATVEPSGVGWKLLVYPGGSEAGSTDCLAAFVECQPPADLIKTNWLYREVKFSIILPNFKDDGKTIVQTDTHTFSAEKTDRGWHKGFGKTVKFTVESGWLDAKGRIRISAQIHRPMPQISEFQFPRMIYTDTLKVVAFKLSSGQSLFFDSRILVARSEYFCSMLTSSAWQESQTNEVDLSEEPLATESSISAMLHFIISDTFHSGDDSELAFAVRTLADRYGLAKLVDAADKNLQRLLSEDNVLSFYGRLLGSGSHLERACLEMIEANGSELLQKQEPKLDQLISENPALAKKLIMTGFKGKKRPRGSSASS